MLCIAIMHKWTKMGKKQVSCKSYGVNFLDLKLKLVYIYNGVKKSRFTLWLVLGDCLDCVGRSKHFFGN